MVRKALPDSRSGQSVSSAVHQAGRQSGAARRRPPPHPPPPPADLTMDTLRRLLARELTVAGWLELGMWLAIPYLAIGIGFTFFQPEFARLAELRLQATLPAGANL